MIAAPQRAMLQLGLLFAALILCAAMSGGCASGVKQARQVTAAAYHVEGAGLEAFDAWDEAHQKSFIARAAPVAEFDAYVELQKKVRLAFATLRHLTNAAADAITSFEKGTVKDVDWIRLLTALMEGARALRDAAQAIGFEVPGLVDLIGKG